MIPVVHRHQHRKNIINNLEALADLFIEATDLAFLYNRSSHIWCIFHGNRSDFVTLGNLHVKQMISFRI